VADGTVDMGLSMFAINEENARLADFSIPYYESGLAIMHLPTTVIKDIADLDGKSIVAMNERSHDPGAALRDIAAAAGVKPRFRAVDRFEEGSRAVASGDADGMVGPHANLDAWIAAGHPEFVRSPLLTHERFAVAVAKGNAELLEQIDAVIADLESSGRLDALLRDAGLSLPESPSR
jgi:ABC-type amino acid transport substrate-binding protein